MNSEKPLTEEEQQEVQKTFSSLCWFCKNARKPAAISNIRKGYVGCIIRSLSKQGTDYDVHDWYDFINECEEIAEGWVDLRTNVFNDSSGMISNLQLLTKGVRECELFQEKQND